MPYLAWFFALSTDGVWRDLPGTWRSSRPLGQLVGRQPPPRPMSTSWWLA